MKTYAVIVASGNGVRMKSSFPKQFLTINNKPLLYYTIAAFIKAMPGINIILVLPEEHVGTGQEIIDGYFDASMIQVTIGGSTRFESVKRGLANIDEECIIFVHDGVRCLVTEVLIHRCYEAALHSGTAIPAISSRDSIRIVVDEDNEALDRDAVKLVQTPQTFHSKILLPAYQIDFKDKFTDEATVVEAFGLKVQLVEGEEENIKITTPADLLVAEWILADRQNPK